MTEEEITKEIKNLNLTKKELNIVLENLIDLMKEKMQEKKYDEEVILYISYLNNKEGVLDYTVDAIGSIQSIVYLIMELCDKNEQLHKRLRKNFEREINAKKNSKNWLFPFWKQPLKK